MMIKELFYKEVVPFVAIVTVLFAEVGANILFKKATLKGLSRYVYIFYSLALSDLFLLIPLPFIIIRRSSSGLSSSLNFPFLCKIFSLGFLVLSLQLCVYKGIEYSSPTLNSAVSNLLPAFIFILAILFRMEKMVLRSSTTQAKILGSIASIAGALIIVLYKGQKILNDPLVSPSPLPLSLMSTPIVSSQRNWVLGGFLLTLGYMIMSIIYILLTHVIKLYPSEMIVVFLFNLFATILAAPVCFLAEPNLSGWRLKPNITLVAVIYTAFFSTFFSTVVHTWGIRVKGPVYVSIFKPFSIVIAAAMSVIFLGETLYLGSVFGAVILCIGFYVVLWGKAKEEDLHEGGSHYFNNSLGSQPSNKVPLLQTSQAEDFQLRMNDT